MIGIGLNRYETYRKYSVAGAPEIPAHWRVMRIKHLANLKSGDSITSEAIETAGEFPVFGGNGLRGYTSSFTHDGEFVLIGRQGALCGNVNYARGQFWASEHAVVANPIGPFETVWLGELLRHLNLNQYSVSAAQPGLSVERIRVLEVPVPPLDEQTSISRFLLHHSQCTSRLIRNKRRLIALLNEEKQAIIQQAVTRGLDPDTPLKPSGVEWLGDIPAHWEVKRNGALFSARKDPGKIDLPILEVSLKTGVRIRDFEQGSRKQVMSNLAGYQTAKRGDIAYNMMRMWQGAVGTVPTDGLVSPAYVVISPRSFVCSQYFSYLYRTAPFMQEVDNYSRGIVKDRNRLYWDSYKTMPCPVPPLDEQQGIVAFIEAAAGKIDQAIAASLTEIELIREYRTRLISDVVTGQLDVRDVQFDDDFSVENLDLGDVELLDDEDVSSEEIDEIMGEEAGIA